MLKIVGRQINRNDELDEDSIEFMTEGKIYQKGSSVYIVYEESEISGMEGVRTTLKIDDKDNVRMKRFGKGVQTDSLMEFTRGKRFESLYQTPFGLIKMEILTNKIVNELKPEEGTGSLFIDYDIALKGLAEMRSLLNIEIQERTNTL